MSVLLAAIALATVPSTPTYARVGHTLVVRSRTFEVGFDARTGGIEFVRSPGGEILAGAPGTSLWRLRFRSGREFGSAEAPGRMTARWLAGRMLRMRWNVPQATVVVDADAAYDHLDLTIHVRAPAEEVLEAALPADLSLAPAAIQRVVFPSDLGIALKPAFFRRVTGAERLAPVHVGADGLRRVAGLTCSLRAAGDPAVPLRVPDHGRRIIGDALAARWQALSRVVDRPSERPPDLDIVASPHGSYVAAHRVGKGWIVRFAGPLRAEDGPLAVATVERLIASLRADGRRRAFVVSLMGAPEPAGWSGVSPDLWQQMLTASAAIQQAGLVTAALPTTRAVLDALRDPGTAVVVNPYAESLPAGELQWTGAADAVRAYLQAGGIWVEAGGYPFYFRLAPLRYYSIASNYPGGFSDFAHVASAGGSFALYGVQDDRRPGAVLAPSAWRAYGGAGAGHLERRWRTLVRRGGGWAAPPVRVLVGPGVYEAARRYAADNAIDTHLPASLGPATADRWKRSVLLAYTGGSYAEETAGLDRLPAGSLIHLWDFLRGGFDKQYPDLLPPNAARGTPEQFRTLIDRARAMGHLVMPYTNHTWWCDDPKGPTFAAAGTAPLLRTLDGQPAREWYGSNGGWSVCPWHPAVQAAADRIVDQFTGEYPVDILFQDQVGARSWIVYDTNPAAPLPWAYQQGWIDLSRRAGQRVPLATEHGFDRLLGSQAEFCGLTWRLVPFETMPDWLRGAVRPYRQAFDDDAWEVFPLAQVVADGGAFFSYHLGGPFTPDRATLAWALALGFQPSLYVSAAALDDRWQAAWLQYLDRLQKAVGPRVMGARPRGWRYVAGSGQTGVIEASIEGVRVVANLTPGVWQDTGAAIAPMGFRVTAPGLDAGVFTAYNGARYDDELWLVADTSPGGTGVSAFTRSAQRVPVAAGAARGDLASRGASPAPLVTIPVAPAIVRGAPPAPPEPGVAPTERRRAPRYIGVLGVDPDSADLYAWTAVRAQDWLDALGAAAPVRAGRLAVRRIGSADDLLAAAAHPDDWLAIVNPYGERLMASDTHPAAEVAEAIERYVQRGGLWFETGGYPFFQSLTQHDGQWRGSIVGPGPMWSMGLSGCAIRAANDDPAALEAGDAGRRWLGDGWAASIQGRAAAVDRPALRDDYEAVILQAVGGRPYLTGHQLGGWGWLFRFGGGSPDPGLATDTVRRLIEVCAARPPVRLPVRSRPRELVTVAAPR